MSSAIQLFATPNPRRFVQDGFVVLPEVFSNLEIVRLRRALVALFHDNKPPFEARFSNTALFDEPLRSIVFANTRLIGALRELLGEDFLFLNEFAAHDSFYSGWHTDTSSPEGKVGHDFHWSPNFILVNVAIYLQDNGETGGGLDVVPRSYLRDDPLAIGLRRDLGFPPVHLRDIDADPYCGALTLRAKAGDATVFHLRTSHRSSIATRAADNDDERKLALFILAGANNSSTRRYRTCLNEYHALNTTSRPNLPADFMRVLSDRGLTII